MVRKPVFLGIIRLFSDYTPVEEIEKWKSEPGEPWRSFFMYSDRENDTRKLLLLCEPTQYGRISLFGANYYN